jgi:hypothetical protein
MKLEDWSYLTFFLFASVLFVPFVQKVTGFRNIYAVYFLHFFLQLIFHRNINNILARHFQKKYGL